jgi:hypothetical protein
MAGIVYIKLLDALKGIGVDVSQQQGSNVKKLAPKNKSTATKPGILASERDSGGNFGTVLDIFKDEAKYIDSMNDAEQMAFLNNILDYNEFGGKGINKTSEGITGIQKDLENLTSTAKTMKDDAEAGLASAEKDLKDFLDTGGQPLKAKNDKYLGGSMHEEGQLRTGIRQFLQTEYKNGRLKLDDLDKARVMEYSPMIEHDPILVFKKIYGDEAYKKAGEFPGAFEIGENFKHYEEIFRENMGEDILKVKDKKYVGDGKLVLTKQEEVFEPTPDDDDIPFAKGGRASFAGGKLVSEFIALIVKKEPIEAMKEVNKVIGKKGKYKNLTQKDIDKIVADTEDHIFQRDPDNLYVYDDGKTIFDDDLTKEQLIEKEGRKLDQENISGSADDMSFEDSIKEMEGLGATQTAERFRLKQKYPGITDDLLNKILIDDNPQRKAEVLATIDEAFRMMEKGKGTEEIIETFKNTTRTKNAKGGRAGFSGGNIVYDGEGPIQFDLPFGKPMFTMKMNGKLFGIYKNKNGSHLSVPLGSDGLPNYAKGGRAGFYMGGQSGQSVIEPDLSDIGHGSDSLMARTRLTAPGSQATTSTGLNYLLGEDNDNTRVPFNDGLLVPKPKPYTEDMFEKDSMTLLKGMYGTGPDSNKFLYNEMIKKGNILRKQGVERETVIEIIRNNKDKINAFLETQTTTPKSFEGMADGGRIGFQDGLSAAKKYGNILVQDETLSERAGKELKSKMSEFIPNETQKEKEEREMFQMVKEYQKFKRANPDSMLTMRAFSEQKKKEKEIIKSKIVELDLKYPEKEIINKKTNMVDKEKLKEAIDQAEASLEISPIDGLKLKRSINTEGEQSVTSGSFSLDNLTFTSPNLEEGQLTTKGNYTFGNLDLSGMVDSNDGKILNTEIGFNYNDTLKGNLNESDGYRSTKLDLNKTFPISDKFNLNLTGDLDTQTFNGKTYRSSDLKPTLSYNNGIFNADISKSVLEGGDTPDLGLGVNYNNFYAKGDNLLSEDRSGIVGYQKEFGNKDGDLFFTAGGEKDIFDDNYTAGVGLKYKFADGGIADLRQGYAGGNIVDKGRRGFLKLLGVTAGGVAALKLGLGKILGKESGAISKKVIDEVIIDGGTGAPAWLQPLVNKALREGTDKTKNLAYKDAQTVKRLDTPTGQVDVYYDVRTGEVEIDYIGGNTALGESVNMRYTPGIADEGTKGKPADEFSATESIPEGRQTGPDDYSIEIGENTTDEVKNLFSDTSELAELGGKKELINDISVTLQKKKKLKQMQENPSDFVTDVQGDYDPT